MIWIISGPSCAGKSSFIEGGRAAQVSGLSAATPTVFPGTLDEKQDPSLSFFFHYNMLRPYRLADRQWRVRQLLAALAGWLRLFPPYTSFQQDPDWRRLLTMKTGKKAVVLVAGQKEILRRMNSRDLIESEFFFPAAAPRSYPGKGWAAYLHSLDLRRIYQEWLRELANNNIDYLLIDSTTYDYNIITLPEALVLLDET